MEKTGDDWLGEQIGPGEPAGKFAKHVPVWSEMAVRLAIMRALERYEARRNEGKS